MQDVNNEGQQSNMNWLRALGLVCAGTLILGGALSEGFRPSLGYLLGYSLPIAVIIWFFFRSYICSSKKTSLTITSFLAIWTSMAVGLGTGTFYRYWHTDRLLTDIVEEADRINEEAFDSEGLPGKIDPIDTRVSAGGELGKIEQLIKTYMNGLVALQNDYMLELEAIGWNQILEPQRLKKPRGFSERELIVKRTKEIIAKYMARTNELIRTTRERIQNLDISQSSKKAMLEGFDSGLGKAKPQLESLWKLEQRSVEEVEALLIFLQNRNENWASEDGQFVFEYERDLEKFNAHMRVVDEIIDEQEKIRMESRANMMQTVNEFRKGS